MAGEIWLSDWAWAAIAPLLPTNRPGARRVDDRRVISGIVHVLKSGCRWKDCPAIYGPPTTIYNRFNRWSWKGLWGRIFAELVARARNALVNGRAIFAVITKGRGAAFRTNLRGEQVGV